MILFAFQAYEEMARVLRKAGDLRLGKFRVPRFENGELHINVDTSVRGEGCFILGSIAPPDEQMLSVLLLSHTLKKEGARQITAILPYLAYARHDKDKPGESLATAWLGEVTKASGIDQIITVDAHSERGMTLFSIPVISLSPAEILAEALCRYGLNEATIVAPDDGAVHRCEAVRRAAGIAPGQVPYFEKQRIATGITHSALIGAVGHQVLMIDDILDTGGTLVSACEKLRAAGGDEIHIMVTHALFTGERWKQLWRLGVKQIFCTDSVPMASPDGGRIEQLSVVPLLEKELCGLVRT